jgi:hypothetical protein
VNGYSGIDCQKAEIERSGVSTMVKRIRVVQRRAVWTGRHVLQVLMATAVVAMAGSTVPADVREPGDSMARIVGTGPNPLKTQPFVVLYRMDRAGNGDGILDPQEIPFGAESFVKRLVTESKVAAPKSIPLRRVAVAWHLRARRSPHKLPQSRVIQPDPSRSRRRKPITSHRDHAASFLGLYDGDGNGSLEQEEWSRIGAGWGEADADGDGVLSLNEVSDRFAAYQKPPAESEDDSTSSGSPDNASEARNRSAHARNGQTSATLSQHRRSYRRRTPHERLPPGIPAWYLQMDTNRDGQVMMVEYAKAWNDEKLAEFNRYDFNRDGIITPRECLKGETER